MKRDHNKQFISTSLPIKLPVIGAIHLDLLITHYLATEFIGKSASTIDSSSRTLRTLDRWLAGRPLIVNRKVDLALFQAYIAHEHGRVQGTWAAVMINSVIQFLNWLVLNGILESDTHRLCKKPRVAKKPPRPRFTIDEYERMKAAAIKLNGSLYWMLVTGWSIGQSFIDCSLLQHRDVDLDSMLVTVVRRKTKLSNATARIHIVAGSDFHLAVLERLKDKDPHYPNNPKTGTYYFDTKLASEAICNLAGLRSKARLDDWWGKMCAMAGVDRRKTFHNLRATMCSTLVNNGVNPIVAIQITGHSSLHSLAGYATVDDSAIREAFVMAHHKQAVKESIQTQTKLLNASPPTPPLLPEKGSEA